MLPLPLRVSFQLQWLRNARSLSTRPPKRVTPYIEELSENQVTALNAEYVSLRSRAKEARLQAKELSEKRRALFLAGTESHESLHGLHSKATDYLNQAVKFDRQASDWIFEQNNKFSRPDYFDLHSLYSREARNHAERVIRKAKKEGKKQVVFIVGRGLGRDSDLPSHTTLRKVLNEVVKATECISVVDPTNPGLLVVFTDPDEADKDGFMIARKAFPSDGQYDHDGGNMAWLKDKD